MNDRNILSSCQFDKNDFGNWALHVLRKCISQMQSSTQDKNEIINALEIGLSKNEPQVDNEPEIEHLDEAKEIIAVETVEAPAKELKKTNRTPKEEVKEDIESPPTWVAKNSSQPNETIVQQQIENQKPFKKQL